MEAEMDKRNTDCVYYLASPLTCKKGSECEYRHSEIARLNPRDCWYWLNSTCLNPSCAFRHPPPLEQIQMPLEGLARTVPEPPQPPSHPPIPTSKANVLCYFYFNAYCIKGDLCPFLHETQPAQKFAKPVSETTIAHHAPEKKASSGSDTGPPSVEVPPNPPGPTLEPIKHDLNKGEPSPSAGSSVPYLEEAGIKLLEENLLPPIEEYTNASPQLYPDEDSDEISKQSAEADEWWESSPGFDVLVDDGSEQLAYEEDADYLLAQERESEMLHFDYEAPPGYDPLGYPDASYLYDHGVVENYDLADKRHVSEYFPRVSEHLSKRRDLEPKSHRKMKRSQRRHEDVLDLRHHLRKLRRTDGSPRKHHLSRTRHSSREQPMGRGMGPPLFSGRLATRVENKENYTHHVSRYPQFTRRGRSRHREREVGRNNRRDAPFLSSEMSQSSAFRPESTQIKSSVAIFSGPKSLEQIKEEKRRAREADDNNSGGRIPQNPGRQGCKDFEGPKPLNEILKHKRRSGIASVQEHGASEDGGILQKQKAGFESDFIDEDDDNEDAICEKLVHMLSS